jgi:AAA15 family ATPase/GTPase
MFIRFGVENHLSIANYEEISFVASSLQDSKLPLFPDLINNHDLLPCALIFGSNASGKSNLLDALFYMSSFVVNSQLRHNPDGAPPRAPFSLNKNCAEKHSQFDCDFIINGVRYHYGFVVGAKSVEEEWLYAYPNGVKQVWYEREECVEYSFGAKLKGQKESIKSFVRPNSLFLSAAAQSNMQQLLPVYKFFKSIIFPERPSIEHSKDNLYVIEKDERILDFLKSSDFGIDSIRVYEVDFDKEEKDVVSAINKALMSVSPNSQPLDLPDKKYDVKIFHRGFDGVYEMDFSSQSLGTQKLARVLPYIFEALDAGAVVVYDEIERSLHPTLCAKIIELFNDTQTNKKGAQLIVASHQVSLLSIPSIRRDQVWLSEKNEHGESSYKSLSDFQMRTGQHLEKKYLDGRFGALPSVSKIERFIREKMMV